MLKHRDVTGEAMADLSPEERELVNALQDAIVSETANAPRTLDDLEALATDIFPDVGVRNTRLRELARMAHEDLVDRQILEPVRGDPDRWQPTSGSQDGAR